MGYNTKNYTDQGGEKTVIGGELSITAEGKLTFDGDSLSKALYQSDSEATAIAGLVVDFNNLLEKLRTAGILFADAPVITLLIEPQDSTVTVGSIEESLALEATVTNGAEMTYQWYSNTTATSTGGTEIDGATESVFALPTTLTIGTYYYYCDISAEEAESVTSNVVTVTVEAA